jgi:hypothetical protein
VPKLRSQFATTPDGNRVAQGERRQHLVEREYPEADDRASDLLLRRVGGGARKYPGPDQAGGRKERASRRGSSW